MTIIMKNIQNAQDLNQAIKALNDEELNQLDLYPSFLAQLIKKYDDFNYLFQGLNDRQVTAVCIAISKNSPYSTESVNELNVLIKSLDVKKIKLLFDAFTPVLTSFIQGEDYSNSQQRISLVEGCIPVLLGLFSNIEEFEKFLRPFELDHDLTSTVCEAYCCLLPELRQKANEVKQYQKYYIITDLIFSKIKRERWPNVIKDSDSFAKFMSLFTENQRNIVFKSCLDAQHFEKIIKRPDDFSIKIFPYLYKSKSDIVFDRYHKQITNLIKNAQGFADSMVNLDDKQRAKIYQALMPSFLPQIIINKQDFLNVLFYLNHDQMYRLCRNLSERDRFPQFLTCSSDFKLVFERLKAEHKPTLIFFLPAMIHKNLSLENIMSCLEREQRLSVCEHLARDLSDLAIAKTASDFSKNILPGLTEKEIEAVCGEYDSFLLQIIKTPSDLACIFNSTNLEQISGILNEFVPFLPKVIKDYEDLNELLCAFTNWVMIDSVYRKLPQVLPNVIRNTKNLHDALNGLTDQRKEKAFQVLILSLFEKARNLSACKTIFLELENEEQNILSKISLPFLNELINNASDCINFIKIFNEDQRVSVAKKNSRLFFFLKDVHDFRNMLQYFEKDYMPLIYNVISHELAHTIHNPQDFDAVKDFVFHFNFEQKIKFLKMFQGTGWLQPFLTQNMSGKDAFRSFFNTTPEQVLNRSSVGGNEPSFEISLAAYALLKEYEQKVSSEKEAHYTKGTWNHLKQYAKMFFNEKDIDKIHRRKPFIHTLFHKSNPGRSSLHPVDSMLEETSCSLNR